MKGKKWFLSEVVTNTSSIQRMTDPNRKSISFLFFPFNCMKRTFRNKNLFLSKVDRDIFPSKL